jgi:MoaA/NifB/PqqE/SkfB family radical SAM enzyme
LTSNTNGCFLSERIIECGLDWLTVSLYHPRLKSPDLANFLYKKGERKPNVAVQALATPNVDVDGFKTYWLHLLNLNDRVVVRPFNNYAGLVKEERKCVRRYPCLALWQTVFIDLYGDVYPCSLSAVHGKGGGMCFGNTLHDDLPGIYGSALVAEARQRHKVGVFEGTCCLDCDAWSDMPNVFFW